MARKKNKVEKKEQKEHKLLTTEEMRAREAKFHSRLTDLRACLNYINEALTEFNQLKSVEHRLETWATYLRCDGLPKPEEPPDVRLFFEKLRFFEKANLEKNIDWLLSVDERSILCQDIFNKDYTHRALVKEIRPNIGLEYETNVDLLLKVLKKIEYFLDAERDAPSLPSRILIDVMEQKTAIHQEILQFFDRYTYRILSSENSFMDNVNSITAEYFYSCDHFQIHIWALKNVPILFEFLEIPVLRAALHSIDVKLQLPYSILEENLAIRAIHFNFDHFSEHAKSFEQKISATTENLSAGIPDLIECLISEWELQLLIQTEVRNEMIERRAFYEEKLRLFLEEEERKKKNKNKEEKPKKRARTVKLPKEPPIITDDTYPDIWEDFLIREKGHYETFINSTYHPEILDLDEDEINMKKFQILGGIYQLYFVTKPTHYKFNAFNMTWHVHNGNLHINHDVQTSRNISQFSLASMRQSRMSRITRLSHASHRNLHAIKSVMEPDEFDDTPYFVLTIKLPKYLCLWGEPQACHFEADIVGFVKNAEVPSEPAPSTQPAATPQPTFVTQPASAAAATAAAAAPSDKAQALDTMSNSTATQIIDVGIAYRPSISLYSEDRRSTFSSHTGYLSTTLTRPSIINVFRPSLLTQQVALPPQLAPTPGQLPAEVEDFRLDLPLTKFQIRNLQRHCLPRIISSFKFPKELKEEETEDARNKSKGKGGTLIRKRASTEDQLVTKDNEVFTSDHQTNPERMFPYFPVVEQMHLMFRIGDMLQHADPETFADLLDTLDKIKRNYRNKFKITMKVPTFKPKVDYRKLRKKKLEQEKHLKQLADEEKEKDKEKEERLSTSSQKLVKSSQDKTDKPQHKGKRKSALVEAKSEFEGKQVQPQKSETNVVKLEEGEEEEEEAEDGEAFGTDLQGEEEEEERETFKFSHWTKEHIINSRFDREKCQITIWTDRLGTLGLAFKRYEHFPFKFWSLEPSPDNPDSEVIFTLDTQYVRCVIFVTAKGFRGYVTEPTKKFVRNRAMFLTIDEPIDDLKELKKIFRDKNINIFSEHDARFYIENGYFSEKHLATELHTYACMAIHSLFIKFMFSGWNRLAERRDIVLSFAQHRESEDNMVMARITPEDATFVEVKELCSDDLDVFKLDYTLTWRNIDHYADLHHLVTSIYLNAIDARVKDAKLICNLKTLLCGIRPLSYS